MKIKLLVALGLVAAITVAATFWLTRAPYAGETEPVYFTVSKIEPVDSVTRKPIDLVAEYAFMASIFIEMGNAMEQAVSDGYLRVDPQDRTATFAAMGTPLTAPLPEGTVETMFDPGNTGASPTFLSYGPTTDTMFIRALAQTSISEDVSFRMTFTRVSAPIDDRIALQARLQEERKAAITAWNAEMDAAQKTVQSDLTVPGPSYRLPLPGDDVTMSVPMHAAYGEFGRYGRVEITDLVTGKTLFKIRPQTLENLGGGLNSDRESFLSKPDADIRVLFEDEQTLLVARRNDTFYFVRKIIVGEYGFALFGFFETLADVKSAWGSALSSADVPLNPADAVSTPDFDAIAWFAERGVQISAVTRFNGNLAGDVIEDVTPAITPQGLMSRKSPFSGTIRLVSAIDGSDEARTHAEVSYFCSIRLSSPDAPSMQHEAHINAIFLGTPRNRNLEWWGQYIESGSFVAGETFEHDMQMKAARGPQVWSYETAQQSFGAEETSYLAYSARPLGPLQLVCSTMSEQPYAALTALQLLAQIDLPDASNLLPQAIKLFRRYAVATPTGDNLFEVKQDRDGTYALIDKDGNQLSKKPFTWSWDYDDHRAFNTKDEAGKYALWSFTGEQLLPYEYDGFDDEPNGIIEAYKDDQTFYYSVPERKFVPKP